MSTLNLISKKKLFGNSVQNRLEWPGLLRDISSTPAPRLLSRPLLPPGDLFRSTSARNKSQPTTLSLAPALQSLLIRSCILATESSLADELIHLPSACSTPSAWEMRRSHLLLRQPGRAERRKALQLPCPGQCSALTGIQSSGRLRRGHAVGGPCVLRLMNTCPVQVSAQFCVQILSLTLSSQMAPED